MTGIEIAAGVALAAGTAVAAVGAIRQGQAAEAAAETNAAIARQEGDLARKEAHFAEQEQRRRTATFISGQRALVGKSGVTTEGSPLLVMSETAADAELDAQAIRFSGSLAEVRARSEAAQQRFIGDQARKAGQINALSSVLTGAAVGFNRFGE